MSQKTTRPIITALGVIAILLGGLWLLQGLGFVHIRPILCFADCAPVQEPSTTWAVIGFVVLVAGVLAIRRATRRHV